MSRSSPWPTSWRGSPGRCCSAGNRLTPTRYPWPRRDSFGRSESAGRASGVCERVTTRWPDSQTALRKPGVENGARRRRVYEDRGARISILAGRRPPRPDTLKQTDQPPISTKPLADGAGHTFSTLSTQSGHREIARYPALRSTSAPSTAVRQSSDVRRPVALRRSQTLSGHAVAAFLRARWSMAPPNPAKPISIIVQVEGSGTAVGLYRTQPGFPSSTACNRSSASVK
jgi:hypothetical protein